MLKELRTDSTADYMGLLFQKVMILVVGTTLCGIGVVMKEKLLNM